MNALIELASVTAGYNESVVLRDVDLTIYERDFLGIIGPNGGGKTTLLRVIMGLLKPYSGKVIFNENVLRRNGGNIGYLPQFKLIDKEFPITVMDVVISGLMDKKAPFKRFNRDQRRTAQDIMKRFGILNIMNRAIGELSGGQMQRVFLCRALISSPQILILDEPDTFVDSNFTQDLNGILKELNSSMAIILVSHDAGSILSSVKNIACVNNFLHYHSAEEFSVELMETYNCPIRLVGHGDVPHTILKKHGEQ